MAPTAFYTFGVFGLFNSHRVTSVNSRGTKTYHTHYKPAFVNNVPSDVQIPTKLRVYAPPSDAAVHPDHTAAIVMAKACFPEDETPFLDVLHMATFPGDASKESYDDHLPNFGPPFVFFMANVLDKAVTLKDGKSHGFTARTSEYVKDGVKDFKVQCILDGTPRWSKTVPPNVNSFIGVLGAFHGKHPEGFPSFLIHSLALNVPSAGNVISIDDSDDEQRPKSPSKRRFELPGTDVTSPASTPVTPKGKTRSKKITTSAIPPRSTRKTVSVEPLPETEHVTIIATSTTEQDTAEPVASGSKPRGRKHAFVAI